MVGVAILVSSWGSLGLASSYGEAATRAAASLARVSMPLLASAARAWVPQCFRQSIHPPLVGCGGVTLEGASTCGLAWPARCTRGETAGARRSLTAGVGERTKGAHSIATRLGVQP